MPQMTGSTMLITGGAGFIGVNTSAFFSRNGWDVIIFDNLSRKGAATNLDWLNKRHDIRLIKGDIRDADLVNRTFRRYQPEVSIHLAGQVAVTTSVRDPRTDFETNALGTLNALEGIRNNSPNTFFINASTNKVYGKMENLGIVEKNKRYEYDSQAKGVSESQPLDFHSPYGCSKGAADQYTIDYGRMYGLNTVTFRQSCIYGPHQMGIEDQGWVAWLIIAVLSDRPISIYGNGKQVRDVLHVDDLIECYQASINRRAEVSGEAFNIGGGLKNTLSLLELLELITQYTGKKPITKIQGWRPGDQPVFVCDLDKANNMLGWQPEINTHTGIESLIDWVRQHGDLYRN